MDRLADGEMMRAIRRPEQGKLSAGAVVSLVARACFVCVLTPFSALAQAILHGTVREDTSDRAVMRAEITLPGAGLITWTTWLGEFRLSGIQPGDHLVVVRAVGFAPNSTVVTLSKDAAVERIFRIRRRHVVLDTIAVTSSAAPVGTLRDLDTRRRSGSGRFIAREELARHEPRRMADVLVQIPGARIRRAIGSSEAWVVSNRGRASISREHRPDKLSQARGAKADCYVNVWLDGVLVFGGRDNEPLFNINSLGAADLEAVEFYAGAGQIPPRFNRAGAACGVLVLWTRVG